MLELVIDKAVSYPGYHIKVYHSADIISMLVVAAPFYELVRQWRWGMVHGLDACSVQQCCTNSASAVQGRLGDVQFWDAHMCYDLSALVRSWPASIQKVS